VKAVVHLVKAVVHLVKAVKVWEVQVVYVILSVVFLEVRNLDLVKEEKEDVQDVQDVLNIVQDVQDVQDVLSVVQENIKGVHNNFIVTY
jgi:hypothetical protein